jgi:tetratricopeptide (TPR) repeat protein
VQEAAFEHDVTFFETDISANGGKVMLVAGAPQSSGNDEEKILRTGRAILERGGVLPVRMGVNAGHVFAGIFGPPYRRTYSIKGDAVNLAARVMGKAAPGQLIATVPVVERSLTVVEAEPMEPFMVKGKKRPVEACLVGEVVGSRAAGWLDLPLVGRDDEMLELMGQVESARGGRGRLVEVVGEPGIGKSRLLQELRSKAPDVDAVAAACDPYESSTPYFPFRVFLRRVLGIPLDTEPEPAGRRLEAEVRSAAPDLLPWLPLLATPLYAEVEPTEDVERLDLEFRKAHLEQAVGELLTSVLKRATMFILEDVHWMDEPSADLLRHLTTLAGQRPWVILVTRRDQPTGFLAPEWPDITTVRPSPLSPHQAAALATAAREDSPLSPHAVAALAERSGGNPLFLQELVSASEGMGAGEALPDSIEDLLTAQIDRLPVTDRTMLRYASVLGASFDQRLLDAVVALDHRVDESVWSRLGEFLSVDSTGGFRFRHALIRDVAYEGLPYRRRREIHARVGETIELWAGEHRSDQAELLSLHFYQAGRYVEAWEYSRIAGERAREKYANVEAADLYRRALDAGRRLPGVPADAVARVHEALGDVAERAGLYETAASAYREARRTSRGDSVREAALLLKEGLIRERAGRYSDAVTWYGRGLRVLEGTKLDRAALAVRAQIDVWYASSRRQQGRYGETVDWCRQAIEDATAADERPALAHAYRILDLLYTKLGRPERFQFRDLALPIYEELGDLAGLSEVLNDLGTDAYFEGRWDEASDLYRRSTEARRKTGDEANAAHGTNNLAEILSDQGHLVEADSLFREVWRIWKAAGYRLPLAYAISNRGRVAARAGRYQEADDFYREALDIFRSKQAEWEVLETRARMAENRLLAGEPDRAIELVSSTLRRVEARGGLPVLRAMLHRLRGYALMATDRARAAAELEESLACARSAEARYEVGLTLLAQAQLAVAAGLDANGLEAEARGILDSLGVVSLPEPPILVPAGA